jgi:hypothetical protein
LSTDCCAAFLDCRRSVFLGPFHLLRRKTLSLSRNDPPPLKSIIISSFPILCILYPARPCRLAFKNQLANRTLTPACLVTCHLLLEHSACFWVINLFPPPRFVWYPNHLRRFRPQTLITTLRTGMGTSPERATLASYVESRQTGARKNCKVHADPTLNKGGGPGCLGDGLGPGTGGSGGTTVTVAAAVGYKSVWGPAARPAATSPALP